MKLALNDINYVIPQGEMSTLYAAAKDAYEKEYLKLQAEELEDAKMQIEDGFIDDISEYDEGNHLAPYDEEANKEEILAKANDYYRASHNLPKSIVVDCEGDKRDLNKEVTDNMVKAHISAVYGVEALGSRYYRYATKADEVKYKAYLDFNAMAKSESYGKFLETVNSIKKYSVTNLMHIYSQKRNASIVNGHEAWKKFGRGVVKGATRIEIFQPLLKSFETEKEIRDFGTDKNWSATYIDSLVDKLNKSRSGRITELLSYKPTGIFDISDTYLFDENKDPLKEIVDKPKHFADGYTEENLEPFKKVLKDYGINNIPNNLDAEEIYALIGDCADRVLSREPEKIVGIDNLTKYKGARHDIEVAVATGLIAAEVGIDTQSSSFEIAKALDSNELKYEDKQKVFTTMFERGYSFAKDFEKNFNKALGKEVDKNIDIDAER